MPLYPKCLKVLLCSLALCAALIAQTADPDTQSQPASSGEQSTQPAKSAPETPQASSGKTEDEKEVERKEQSHRLLGVIPDFGTTSRHDASPLTPGEKFHLFTKSAFDPVEFGVVGLQAGLSQAEDEFPEYGQGAAGFGKRYGSTLADEISSSFWANYFYPVLLKEDPRYFRLGEGTIGQRFKYALSQEVIAHTDSGGRSFAWENVLGAFTTGGVSNLYYPPAERGLGLTLSRSAISIGYGSLGGLVDEFYPDIAKHLFHHRDKAPQAQPASSQP
jgi:hypothetical protein